MSLVLGLLEVFRDVLPETPLSPEAKRGHLESPGPTVVLVAGFMRGYLFATLDPRWAQHKAEIDKFIKDHGEAVFQELLHAVVRDGFDLVRKENEGHGERSSG